MKLILKDFMLTVEIAHITQGNSYHSNFILYL